MTKKTFGNISWDADFVSTSHEAKINTLNVREDYYSFKFIPCKPVWNRGRERSVNGN